MIVYINGNDNRCLHLISLLKEAGHQIQNDRRMIGSCDLVFLGRDGKEFEQVDFKNKALVLTLLKNHRLCYLSKLKGFLYEYLYRNQDFVLENSYICDEALIAYMIIDNQISLANSNILILGYGNCGKDLANKLDQFKAKISICTRNNHYHDEIVKHGFRYVRMHHLALDGYDFIINTVPSNIIDEKILRTKDEHCKIYDVASIPYGMEKRLWDSSYHLMKQLPTKYAYQTSAKILFQAIMRVVEQYAKK